MRSSCPQMRVLAVSERSKKHYLNEDAYGWTKRSSSITAWVIDGATALPPASNDIIHSFVSCMSQALHQCALVEEDPIKLLEAAKSMLKRDCTTIFEESCKLPKYARPLASVAIVTVKYGIQNILHFASWGDCGLAIASGGEFIIRLSRAEGTINKMLANGASASDIILYRKRRRLFQMRASNCRWLTLENAGVPGALVGKRNLAASDVVLLGSDGYWATGCKVPTKKFIREFIGDDQNAMAARALLGANGFGLRSDDATAIAIHIGLHEADHL